MPAQLCHRIFDWLLPIAKETTSHLPILLAKLPCLPAVTMPLSKACLNTFYTSHCAFWQAAADGFTPCNIALSADFSFGEDGPECGHCGNDSLRLLSSHSLSIFNYPGRCGVCKSRRFDNACVVLVCVCLFTTLTPPPHHPPRLFNQLH